MRTMAVTALAISLLAAALIAQSAPRATTPAGAASDPSALLGTTDRQAMPEQSAHEPF